MCHKENAKENSTENKNARQPVILVVCENQNIFFVLQSLTTPENMSVSFYFNENPVQIVSKFAIIMLVPKCSNILRLVYTPVIMRYTSLEILFVFWLCLEENASENYL